MNFENRIKIYDIRNYSNELLRNQTTTLYFPPKNINTILIVDPLKQFYNNFNNVVKIKY